MMVDSVFRLLLTQAWQIALLIVAVWIVVRLFAKDRPHLAHALWVLVLIKCLTPPLISSPTSPFSWLGTPRTDRSVAPSQPAPQSPIAMNTPATDQIVVRMRPEASVLNNQHRPETREVATNATALTRDKDSAQPIDWLGIGKMIWLGGFIAFALLTMIRLAGFARMIRRASTDTPDRMQHVVDGLARELGVRRPVRMLTVTCAVGPLVWGLLRPRIVFPASMVAGKSPEELRPLLAHELIHIRRGDLMCAFLQLTARTVFWFHPLVWCVTRWVTRESERSCDEETVASLGCRPATYARGLLSVLEEKHRLKAAPALPGVRPVDITSARLERVMRMGQGSHRRAPWWVWMIMLLCGAVVLPGASFVSAQQQEEAKPLPRLPRIGEVLPYPVGLPETRAEGAPGSDWRIRAYDVSALLEQLRELGVENEAEFLIGMLPHHRPGPDGQSSTPNAINAQISTEHGIVKLGHDEPTMKIAGTQLHALATEKIQEIVKDSLERFQAHGFEQIMVQSRFVTTPPEKLSELGIDWSIAESTIGESVESLDAAQVRSALDAIDSDESNGRGVSATSLVEKSAPVIYAFLDDDQVKSILDACRGDARTNILSAPQIMMNAGQVASIIDGSSRPFVVGLNRVKDEKGNLSDTRQPVVRVVTEGSTLNVRADAIDNNLVKLDCHVTFAKIRSVETFELPVIVDDERVKLQVPEVEKTCVQSSLEVPQAKTLAMSFNRKDEQGEFVSFIVMLQCHVIDPTKRESGEIEAAGGESALDAPLAQLPDVRSSQPAEYAAREPHGGVQRAEAWQKDDGSRFTPLVIRSDQPADEAVDTSKLREWLKEQGLELDLAGRVQFTFINDDGAAIYGESLVMSLGDPHVEYHVSGDRGEIIIKNDSEFQLTFEGDVRFRLDGVDISAEKVTYGTDTGLIVEGGAIITHAEFRLAADRIQFEHDDSEDVLMFGDATLHLHKPDEPPVRVTAERIRWNSGTNAIEASNDR